MKEIRILVSEELEKKAEQLGVSVTEFAQRIINTYSDCLHTLASSDIASAYEEMSQIISSQNNQEDEAE